jgi:aminobenzoyl-glutamate utilization protein B
MASEALAMGAITLLASPETIATAKAELSERTGGKRIPGPAPTISDVLAKDPQSFWDATWAR